MDEGAKVVDLGMRRFERDAAPGVDACIRLIEGAVLAGVTDPTNAAKAIFFGGAGHLLQHGYTVEQLQQACVDVRAALETLPAPG